MRNNNSVSVKMVSELAAQGRWQRALHEIPEGEIYKDLSTVVVIPIIGTHEEKGQLVCKCRRKHEYTKSVTQGLHYAAVTSWRNIIKPMNQLVTPEIFVPGREVGAAYNAAVELILGNSGFSNFKYMLTVEVDNIVPYMPGTHGPLYSLYDCIERGFDAAGGLYWTKGIPSMPLLYGNPDEVRSEQKKATAMFKVLHPSQGAPPSDWKEGRMIKGGNGWYPGDIVECNGLGMGFTLFKLDIFRDKRLEKPWFKTCNEMTAEGAKIYTQDLYFFEKFRKLGYRCCVDTRVRLGHMDMTTGQIF